MIQRKYFQKVALMILLVNGLLYYSSAQNNSDFLKLSSYSIQLSNTNGELIGFKRYTSGETESVTGIARFKSSVYLVDPIFNNVKKVDIETGKYVTSKNLINTEGVSLYDIKIFNDDIFISTDGNLIIVLDESLQIKRTIGGDFYYGAKSFLIFDDELYVYSDPAEVFQQKDYVMKVSANNLTQQLKKDTLSIGKGYGAYQELKLGFTSKAEKNCILIDRQTYCMDRPFPRSNYPCRNVYLDEEFLFFYEILESQLILSVYRRNGK